MQKWLQKEQQKQARKKQNLLQMEMYIIFCRTSLEKEGTSAEDFLQQEETVGEQVTEAAGKKEKKESFWKKLGSALFEEDEEEDKQEEQEPEKKKKDKKGEEEKESYGCIRQPGNLRGTGRRRCGWQKGKEKEEG